MKKNSKVEYYDQYIPSKTGDDVQFNKIIQTKTITIESKTEKDTKKLIANGKYKLHTINLEVIKAVNTYYTQLPNLANLLYKSAKLAVNKGIEKEDSTIEGLEPFFETLGGENTDFLISLAQAIQSKSNVVLYLNIDSTTGKPIWKIIEPRYFGILTDAETDGFDVFMKKAFCLIKNGNLMEVLDQDFTIFYQTLGNNFGSIYSIPRLYLSNLISDAILFDQVNFVESKKCEKYDKQLAIVDGGTPKEIKELSDDINNGMANPKKAVHVTSAKVTQILELSKIKVNPDFKDYMDTTYAQHIANLADVAGYMNQNASNLNRASAEQLYKEMIQSNSQSLNNILSGLVKKMYKITRKVSPELPDVEITVANPLYELDLNIDMKNLIQATKEGYITVDEFRKKLGFEVKT
jgi:hypothetical protein